MADQIRELLIRRVWLQEKYRPFEIHDGKPIEVDWMAITHAATRRLESFNLTFLRSDGHVIDWTQFDALDIALDRARAIVGVEWSEWQRCSIPIMSMYDRVSWEDASCSG